MQAELIADVCTALRDVLIDFHGPKVKITFEEYLERYYIPYLDQKMSKQLHKDLQQIDRLRGYVPDIQMADFNKNCIQAALDKIKNTRKISNSTVNRYRSRLLAIFNHAINEGIIMTNPVRGIKKYKEFYRDRALSHHEALTFLESCKASRNDELYEIVLVALHTGMRQNEILGLRSDNISNGQIVLHGQQTKSGYARAIPMHPNIKPILEQRAELQGSLFKSKSIRTAIEKAIERSKLVGFRFHDMRRTCATWLKDKGVDLHTIAKILGHTNITMTERYLATTNNRLLEAIETLPRLIE